MRVLFFPTCLINEFDAAAGLAAARLLRRLGVDVRVPSGPACCGQPAFNAGHFTEARRIAAATIDGLDGADYIVLPSGSCSAMLRNHTTGLFEGEAAARASAIASRTYELAQFIVRVLGVTRLGDGLRDRNVAYHHGCHALRELCVRDEPLILLRSAGAHIVEWEADSECCGFGGLFAVKFPEVSAAMADRKIDALARTDAGALPDVLTSTDGGCLLQLGGRLRHRGIRLPVRHLAHLLDEAANGTA